jgi:hypothetical protein
MNTLLLALVFSQIPTDARWYDNSVMPPVYQNSRLGLLAVGYNPSAPISPQAKAHKFGTPSNHFPWLHVGGTPDGGNVTTLKALWIPPGKKIKVWLDRTPLPSTPKAIEWRWQFPVGTIRAVRLLRSDGVVFSQHVSKKISEGNGIDHWSGSETITAKPPSWYKSPTNCVDCHKDVGRHAEELRPKEKNYYFKLRGWDGVFSWHPFRDANKAGGNHLSARLRNDARFDVSSDDIAEAEQWHKSQEGILTIIGE